MGGIQKIAIERARQINEEGHCVADDITYNNGGQLTKAAMCYLNPDDPDMVDRLWPWRSVEWSPSPENRVKELTKAGALIAAELDRLTHTEDMMSTELKELEDFSCLLPGDRVTVVTFKGITNYEFLSHDPKLSDGLSKYNYAYMLESFGREKVERWHISALESVRSKFFISGSKDKFCECRIKLLDEEIENCNKGLNK